MQFPQNSDLFVRQKPQQHFLKRNFKLTAAQQLGASSNQQLWVPNLRPLAGTLNHVVSTF